MTTTVADSVPPNGIDLEYCGIGSVSTKTFTLTNPTFNTVKFEILVDNLPFEISPLKGTTPHIWKFIIQIYRCPPI